MNNLARFSVIAPVETALKKLAKAEIAVYNIKKDKNRLLFSVSGEYAKKVFAIFAHPCYNIQEIVQSPKKRFVSFLKNRFALLIGAALFVAAASLSQNFIFKIELTGNGDYLRPQILKVLSECGVEELRWYNGMDKPYFRASVMSLPGVTFCSVEKAGSVIKVDVRCSSVAPKGESGQTLLSETSGEVVKITAICGTAAVKCGDKVQKGAPLILPYTVTEDGVKTPCLAVGYAEVKRTLALEYHAAEESEENKKRALSSVLVYSETAQAESVKVKKSGDGVIYLVSFSYVCTYCINME